MLLIFFEFRVSRLPLSQFFDPALQVAQLRLELVPQLKEPVVQVSERVVCFAVLLVLEFVQQVHFHACERLLEADIANLIGSGRVLQKSELFQVDGHRVRGLKL